MSKLSRPNGRPKWQPDDDQRAYIRQLASEGYPQQHIALIVGISRSTLKRRCPQELHEGTLIAYARLAAVAFEMGTSGDDPVMTMFLLRCRVGWNEPRSEQIVKFISMPVITKTT